MLTESDMYTDGCEISKLASTNDEDLNIRTDVRMVLMQYKKRYQNILQEYQEEIIKKFNVRLYFL